MPTASWRRRSSEMASGKRASMREGPLAALFRKTEEEGLHGEGVPQREGTPAEPPRAERQEFRPPPEAEARPEDQAASARPEPSTGRLHPSADGSEERLQETDPRL